jgi:hypothetical protein
MRVLASESAATVALREAALRRSSPAAFVAAVSADSEPLQHAVAPAARAARGSRNAPRIADQP